MKCFQGRLKIVSRYTVYQMQTLLGISYSISYSHSLPLPPLTMACFFLELSFPLPNLDAISFISFLVLCVSLSSSRACVGVRGGREAGGSIRDDGPDDAEPPRARNTSSIKLGPKSKELLRNGCRGRRKYYHRNKQKT